MTVNGERNVHKIFKYAASTRENTQKENIDRQGLREKEKKRMMKEPINRAGTGETRSGRGDFKEKSTQNSRVDT